MRGSFPALWMLGWCAATGPALASDPPPATVTGTVCDAETAELLPGAVVTLPAMGRATATDAEGRYTLTQVPAGDHEIAVRSLGYASRTVRALVPPDGTLQINVALTTEPLHVPPLEIHPQVIMRGAEPGASAAYPDRGCSIAAIRNHPLLGEPDTFQGLGGGEVFLRPESPSGVHIRGGTTDQTAYLLDGIPAFNPYHTAGVVSAWNPDAISYLELLSADPALSSLHALSGTIEGVTRIPGGRFSGQGSMSTTQSRATIDGPLGFAGAGYLVSIRSGLPNVLAPHETSYLEGGTRDWITTVNLTALGGQMRLLAYDSRNDIHATAVAEAAERGTQNAFEWQSQSYGIDWRRDFTRTAVRMRGFTAGSDAESRWAVKGGGIGMEAERIDAGMIATVERRAPHTATQIELRAVQSRTTYDLAADSTTSFTDAGLSAKTPVATLLAQQSRALRPDLAVKLGASLAFADGGPYVGPGAEIRWAASRTVTFNGSFARAHQFSQSLRNPESVVGNVFPVDLAMGASAPGIPVARSDQGVVACDYHPTPGLRVGLQAYQRAADGLVLVAPVSGEPFLTSGFTIGSGSTRGLAVDLGVTGRRYGITASYGLERVRLDYDGGTYVPEHAPRHLLEGGVTYLPSPSRSLRLGAAGEFGRRTTPVTGGVEWEACNLVDRGCEFAGSPYQGGDQLGTLELPAYFRVDFGFRKMWRIRAGDRDAYLAMFGTATNLLGRKNLLAYAEVPGSSQLSGIEMRPPSPLVVGLDWRF